MTKKKLLLRRGTFANLPDLDEGEPGWITDKKILVIGDSSGSEGTFINFGSVVHPEEYGAVGDGTTDDAVAIQAAIDSLALTGGRILFTSSSYNLGTTGITITGNGNILEGISPRFVSSGTGVEFLYSGTGEAVTFGVSGTINYRNEFNNIQVRATDAAMASATAIGIKMINQHYLTSRNAAIKDFQLGTGLYLTAAGAGMYGATCQYHGLLTHQNKYAIKSVGIDATVKDNHAIFFGGAIIGESVVVAGSVGIDLNEFCDGYKFYGTDVESFAIGIQVDADSTGFFGTRTEFNTKAFNITANAARTEIYGHQWTGTNRDIDDAGSLTMVFDNYGWSGSSDIVPIADTTRIFNVFMADATTHVFSISTDVAVDPRIQIPNSGDLFIWSDSFTTETVRMEGGTGTAYFAGPIYAGSMTGVKQTNSGTYAGNGAPDDGVGENGDFYFRADGTKAGNTVIYHKEAGSWVALVTA